MLSNFFPSPEGHIFRQIFLFIYLEEVLVCFFHPPWASSECWRMFLAEWNVLWAMAVNNLVRRVWRWHGLAPIMHQACDGRGAARRPACCCLLGRWPGRQHNSTTLHGGNRKERSISQHNTMILRAWWSVGKLISTTSNANKKHRCS